MKRRSKARSAAEAAELKRLIREQERDRRTNRITKTAGMEALLGLSPRDRTLGLRVDDSAYDEAMQLSGQLFYRMPNPVAHE